MTDSDAKAKAWIARKPVKRLMDLLIAGPAFLVALPVMLFVAAAVRVKLGSPVFFRQRRVGYRESFFMLVKFRTMTDETDESGDLLPDEQRLTSFGRFLRSASLDELPEILHVLKGEMSVVGPRPLLPEYLDVYTERQRRRHELPPGMAGPVMAKGRNALTWSEKFEWDVWYVENQSLWVDVKLLVASIGRMLRREGISHEGHATMEKFEGTEPRPDQGPT